MEFELDLGRTIILLIIPMVLLGFAFVLRSREIENWIIRKYVHSVGLVVAGLYGAFMDELLEILVLVVILIVLVLLLSLPPIYFIQQLTSMAVREGESQRTVTINGFSTSFGVILLIIIFFDEKWIFLASVYCVAIGDGLGEFIGKPFGKHKYKVFNEKSIEGSLGVSYRKYYWRNYLSIIVPSIQSPILPNYTTGISYCYNNRSSLVLFH